MGYGLSGKKAAWTTYLVKLGWVPIRADYLNLILGPPELDEEEEPMLHSDDAA